MTTTTSLALLLLCSVLLLAAAQPPMPENAWERLAIGASTRFVPPVTGSQAFQFPDAPAADPNPRTRAFSGLAAGPGGQPFCLWGGAHRSYPGNDWECFDPATLTWTQTFAANVSKPEACPFTSPPDPVCGAVYSGSTTAITPAGNPYTDHSYNEYAFHPPSGRWLLSLPSGTWWWAPATRTWSRIKGIGPEHGANSVSSRHVFGYQASVGAPLIAATAGPATMLGVYRGDNLDGPSPSWTKICALPLPNWTLFWSAYNPDKDEHYVWSHYYPVAQRFWRLRSTASSCEWTSLPSPPGASPPYYLPDTFDYDSVNRRVVALNHPANGDVRAMLFEVERDAWAWQVLPPPVSQTPPPSNVTLTIRPGGGAWGTQSSACYRLVGTHPPGVTDGSEEKCIAVQPTDRVQITWTNASRPGTGLTVYRAAAPGTSYPSPSRRADVGSVTSYIDPGGSTISGALPTLNSTGVPPHTAGGPSMPQAGRFSPTLNGIVFVTRGALLTFAPSQTWLYRPPQRSARGGEPAPVKASSPPAAATSPPPPAPAAARPTRPPSPSTASSSSSPPPAALSSAPQSFAQRCAQAEVVRCFGFDSVDAVAPYVAGANNNRNRAVKPTFDSAVKASGAGSLRFTVPSLSGPDSSGSFSMNFTPGSLNGDRNTDYPVTFGEGTEFYIQWRQRFSPEFLANRWTGGGGAKMFVVGQGDTRGRAIGACTDNDIVVVDYQYRGFPRLYHSCGAYDRGQYFSLYETLRMPGKSTPLIKIQNLIEGCVWHYGETAPPCVGLKADQWMTFQIHVRIGTWYKNDRNYNKDSRVDFWVAEEGKPSIQVLGLDVDLCCGPSYGKMWFTPYNTRKDPNAAHPEAYTWYDDIVVSRTRIAEPALESPAAGVRTTPTSPRAAAKSGLTTVAASARTPTTSSTAAPGNASTSPPL